VRKIKFILSVFLLFSSIVAQTSTGNIYGTIVDTEKNPFPRVTITLTGLAFQGLVQDIPVGKGMVVADFNGTKLELYTYKPSGYNGERMIMVFHGSLHNADEYRDHSVEMGDRFKALIIAPKFDAERFPSIKYQRGGITTADGKVAPPEEWTYAFVPKIFQAVKEKEGKPGLKYWIIGHSAGGQFVSRMAAFQDTGAERLVAANPSSWPFPTRALLYTYGFGGLPESLSNDEMIRKFLAQPLTIYLGTADNTPDKDTDMSDGALVEGSARYQRGKAFFQFAKTIAERKKWDFNWHLVEAEGVNHDHGKMFNHPNCEKALFGPFGQAPSPSLTASRRERGTILAMWGKYLKNFLPSGRKRESVQQAPANSFLVSKRVSS